MKNNWKGIAIVGVWVGFGITTWALSLWKGSLYYDFWYIGLLFITYKILKYRDD